MTARNPDPAPQVEGPSGSDAAASEPVADDLVRRLRAAGCVFAEDEAALLSKATDNPAERDEWCRRREAGEPLEQILGWVEFAGDRYQLGPGVFVPRLRSQLLVEQAVATIRDSPRRSAVLVEMCCGVGAIGIAIVRRVVPTGRSVQAHLADVDPAALRWATRNAALLPEHARPRVHQGDLWSALPARVRGRVDLVVANAPYVPTAELPFLPGEARNHEPGFALDGGADGADLHRRIVAATPEWLRPGGSVLIETSDRQADLTATVMTDAGLDARIERDLDRAATVVSGRRDERSTGGPG